MLGGFFGQILGVFLMAFVFQWGFFGKKRWVFGQMQGEVYASTSKGSTPCTGEVLKGQMMVFFSVCFWQTCFDTLYFKAIAKTVACRLGYGLVNKLCCTLCAWLSMEG